MPDPQTRERLLDAAWRVATDMGVTELTLARVGAVAGVSRQAVYLHFGNRATLLVEMARRFDTTSGFRARLREAREAEPVAAFRAVLDAWFRYVPEVLPVHRALEAAALAGGDGADAYRDRMGEWRDGLRVDVQRLADDGALRSGWTVDEAADWVWAHVHPTHVLHLCEERGWGSEAVADRVTEALGHQLIDDGR